MNKTETFPVEGMHCASCGAIITRTLKKEQGVADARVSPGTEQATITYDPDLVNPRAMNEKLAPLGYALRFHPEEHMEHGDHHEHGSPPSVFIPLGFAIITFFIMLWELVSGRMVIPAVQTPLYVIVASIMLFGYGRQFLAALFRFIRYGAANMDTLVGLGTGVSYLYSLSNVLFPTQMASMGFPDTSYFDVTIIVIGFVLFGNYLEASAKQKTGEALALLMKLQVKTAWVKRKGKLTEVPIDAVVVGDVIHIKPGSAIPVDGVLVGSYASIDESLITGESMPVDKKRNDPLIGGTINLDTAIVMEAKKVGNDTVLSHIIRMVGEAQNSKAPIERLTDRISAVFVPVVLGIALVTFIGWMLFGSGFVQPLFPFALSRFITILVIACPCALGLATPTAVVTAVGRAARMGILIKDAEHLELLSSVATMVLDKTGTLTQGKPTVGDIMTIKRGSDAKFMVQILASLEQQSEHPVGTAIVAYAKEKLIPQLPVLDFKAFPGMGIEGTIEKTHYYAGNMLYMKKMGIPAAATLSEMNGTAVYVASEKNILGSVVLTDSPKKEARSAVTGLTALGITPVMLSGDDKKTAQAIADEVGITEVIAPVLPEQKLVEIERLKKSGRVAMVGDGVNDAPALAMADVGIAMATGTDVAIATSGITILHGDLQKLVQSIVLARHTMKIIKQNLFWAFFYNIIGIPLAAGFLYPFFHIQLSPVFAGAAMALSSVTVVGNSLRLKTIKI